MRSCGGRTIHFAEAVPPTYEGELERDITVESPDQLDLAHWPDGGEAPSVTVCRSIADPGHYRVFKYASEVKDSGFTPTGYTFGSFWKLFDPRKIA